MKKETNSGENKKIDKALAILSGSSDGDSEEALEILEKEAESGNRRAQFEFAKAKFEYDEAPDLKKNLDLIAAAAEKGLGSAAFWLSILYRTGSMAECFLENAVTPDAQKEKAFFNMALQANYPPALLDEARRLLGEMKLDEVQSLIERFPKSITEEFDKQDFSSWQIELKDLKETLRDQTAFQKRYVTLKKKAEKGDMESAFILGADLLNGTKIQETEGRLWLEKAAQSGHHRAKQILKSK